MNYIQPLDATPAPFYMFYRSSLATLLGKKNSLHNEKPKLKFAKTTKWVREGRHSFYFPLLICYVQMKTPGVSVRDSFCSSLENSQCSLICLVHPVLNVFYFLKQRCYLDCETTDLKHQYTFCSFYLGL